MRGVLFGFLVCAAAAPLASAPDDLPAEVLLLAHFKQEIRRVLSQVPNYTCLETIERQVQRPNASTPGPRDIVRLEVSTVGDREMRALPGAARFEERDLTSFASTGLMGSGAYASYARTVFVPDTTTIHYHGEEDLSGRTAARYDFRVPPMWSGFHLRVHGVSGIAGIKGSFWVDPVTLDLMQLNVEGDQIPPEIGIERTATMIRYAPMRIGGVIVQLPQSATMTLALSSGEVHTNDSAFSHCREYSTDSSISFDLPEASAPANAARRVNLPPGLMVPIELETALDVRTLHVGDMIRGHVADDVRRKGEIVIPKGAVATGRIRSVDRLDVTVELAELTWPGTRAEFYAELLSRENGRSLPIPGTGVLHLSGEPLQIAPGLRTNWRTLEPNQPAAKKK